jgi:hypothetical protein
MARPKCWQWEQFEGDSTEKVNKAHNAARCKACVAHFLELIEAQEQRALNTGLIQAMRGKSLLHAEGTWAQS